MKKIMSIIISVTLLLICLSGCGESFKQGDIFIPESEDFFVASPALQNSSSWDQPASFKDLNNRITEESKLDDSFTHYNIQRLSRQYYYSLLLLFYNCNMLIFFVYNLYIFLNL